jgi:bifunctional ADP-heptose synthase (sugar kinase/adenylyltransferase)
MIVSFDELLWYRGLVTMVDGGFDPLHAGHILYFHAAMNLGHPVLCNIASDRYITMKHPPLLPDWQRATVIDALRLVQYTHLSEHATGDILQQLRPHAYVKGIDWEGRLPVRQVEICDRYGIQIVFVDTVIESSSQLLRVQTSASRNRPT